MAATKYYEIQKTRAEAVKAQKELHSKDDIAPILQAGSTWKGRSTWTQGTGGPSALSLVVTDRTGNSFRGLCTWGDFEKGDVAEVEGQAAQDQVTFREVKLLKGNAKHYPIPCVWKGTLSTDRLKGTWARGTASDGTFEMVCQQ